MFLDIIQNTKNFIEFLIIALVCSVIFCVQMGYNMQALISFVALYFFAALRLIHL